MINSAILTAHNNRGLADQISKLSAQCIVHYHSINDWADRPAMSQEAAFVKCTSRAADLVRDSVDLGRWVIYSGREAIVFNSFVHRPICSFVVAVSQAAMVADS